MPEVAHEGILPEALVFDAKALRSFLNSVPLSANEGVKKGSRFWLREINEGHSKIKMSEASFVPFVKVVPID